MAHRGRRTFHTRRWHSLFGKRKSRLNLPAASRRPRSLFNGKTDAVEIDRDKPSPAVAAPGAPIEPGPPTSPVSDPCPISHRDFEALRTQALQSDLQQIIARLATCEDNKALRSASPSGAPAAGKFGHSFNSLKGDDCSYLALVEAMNEGAAALGVDREILYCNQHLCDLIGLPMDQIVGHSAIQFLEEEDYRFEQAFIRALAGFSVKVELEMCDAHGRRIPVIAALRKMEDNDCSAISVVVTDLTEANDWKRLAAAGRLANLILESSGDAIAVCDDRGVIIRGNRALEELCASNPVSQPFDRALPLHIEADTNHPTQAYTVAMALGGQVHSAREMTLQPAEGPCLIVQLSSGRIVHQGGARGCVITLTDITNRKLAERELIRAEKLASVGRLASTLAHEINNPLEAVSSILYLALTDLDLPPHVHDYLSTASREVDRIGRITRQTLDFHPAPKPRVPLNLAEKMDQVLSFYSHRFETRAILVKRRYAEVQPIPAVAGEISQIITSLVSNSMDAVKSNGVLACRVARAFRKDGAPAVRLTIADSGSGILPESLGKIFEPFFTTKEFVGTGLGLWVTKQLVEKHGASIRVRSKPGVGTAFSVFFPTVESPEELRLESRAS